MKNYNFLPAKYINQKYNTVTSYKKLVVLLGLLNIFSFGNLYMSTYITKEVRKMNIKNNETISTNVTMSTNEKPQDKEIPESKILLHLDMLMSDLKTINVKISSVSLSGTKVTMELTTLKKEQYYNAIILIEQSKFLRIFSLNPLSSEQGVLHYKIVLEEVK